MARRSAHTPDELRELILQAATELITIDGLDGVSAREIAKRIDYSPGTLYNVFAHLDDIILTIEGRLLDSLNQRLEAVRCDGPPRECLVELARIYLEFTHENPKLWTLLFQHRLARGRKVPPWYAAKIEGLTDKIEFFLRQMMRQDDNEKVRDNARVLWAGIHGITSLSNSGKLETITQDAAAEMMRKLVLSYLNGLAERAH